MCVCVCVCVMKCAYLKAFESTPALTGWGAINNLCIDMARASDLISQSLDLIALALDKVEPEFVICSHGLV